MWNIDEHTLVNAVYIDKYLYKRMLSHNLFGFAVAIVFCFTYGFQIPSFVCLSSTLDIVI